MSGRLCVFWRETTNYPMQDKQKDFGVFGILNKKRTRNEERVVSAIRKRKPSFNDHNEWRVRSKRDAQS